MCIQLYHVYKSCMAYNISKSSYIENMQVPCTVLKQCIFSLNASNHSKIFSSKIIHEENM